MNTFLTLPTASIIGSTDGEILAKSIWETANGQADAAKATILVVASVVVAAMILVVAIRSKFAVGKVLATAAVGALVLWLVYGGIDNAKTTVDDTVNNSSGVGTTDSSVHEPTAEFDRHV